MQAGRADVGPLQRSVSVQGCCTAAAPMLRVELEQEADDSAAII